MQTRPTRGRSKARYAADYQTFLDRLTAARDRAGLTQREAAARLGRTQAFIRKCETGERRVDIVELAQFARLYRKPLAWFAPFLRGK